MKSQLIHEAGGERTFVLVFGTDDPVKRLLDRFVVDHGIAAARFTAIGALSAATLGYFDWDTKNYTEIPVGEQVEVLSLIGDVALKDGVPTVHAHMVVGRADGSTRGGHLIEAHVRPTLELILVESPRHLRKRVDPESGLALIDLDPAAAESDTPEPTDV